MTDRYSVIDPSQLGTMEVIVPSDEEVILARRMAKVKERWTAADPPYGADYDVDGLEFDPLKVGQEVGTSFQLNLESRVNQAARDTTLAFGYGRTLDAIASRYPGGCPRLPVVPNPRPIESYPQDWETDSRYRKRIWLSPNSFSTAGTPEGYEFWAMTAAPTLADVKASMVRTTDGPVVQITCLGSGPTFEPTPDEILDVQRMLGKPNIKPLTDIVSVGRPAFIDTEYSARVWLYPGPDASAVKTTLEKRLAAYLADLRFLGKDHTDDGFVAALRIEGVTHSSQRVAPAKTIRVGEDGFVRVLGTPTIVIPRERLI
jgi:phage-related baseplate assembly protein